MIYRITFSRRTDRDYCHWATYKTCEYILIFRGNHGPLDTAVIHSKTLDLGWTCLSFVRLNSCHGREVHPKHEERLPSLQSRSDKCQPSVERKERQYQGRHSETRSATYQDRSSQRPSITATKNGKMWPSWNRQIRIRTSG